MWRILLITNVFLLNIARGQRLPPDVENIFSDLSWRLKVRILNRDLRSSPPPIIHPSHLWAKVINGQPMRRNLPSSRIPPELDDENNIKLKLFRLMYETVSESDLKVQRAEMIRTFYNNSKIFEVGYLMGDVTDKYKSMKDISDTLTKYYNDWKPIEHINAYEQIANQAIEIINVIEIMKGIEKNSTISRLG